MKIAIIGLGAVALSDALAFARDHDVVLTGPVPDRVDAINRGEFGLNDPCLRDYLACNDLRLRATLNTHDALDGADMVFVSAPLSVDPRNGRVCLAELDSRIELAVRLLPLVPVAIRSAVPPGYTEAMRDTLESQNIVYAPEFGRVAAMLTDLLNPAFILVGDRNRAGQKVAALLRSVATRPDVPCRLIGPAEAEALRHLAALFQTERTGRSDHLSTRALRRKVDPEKLLCGILSGIGQATGAGLAALQGRPPHPGPFAVA